ncbi:MAG: hypothetical protein HGA43_10445 [Nitrospirae bacterium]|nr:hypothetical protein [Nitrospirota bacterium]
MKPVIAKLTRPRLTSVVERQRLLEHLDSLREKIIWISAPAGSGKTTLAANWLDSRKLPCIWYQADEGDADIATFFSYLGKAAKHAAPRYRTPLPLFTPEYALGIPIFIKRYFEVLFSRVKPPFCFVIDNYQDVPGDSPFHEILRDGLSIAPEGISAVIVSRSDPPPTFARLQAISRLEVMRREEIWFTLKETEELIKSRGKKRAPDDVLKTLYQKTEGWAAGLVLMSESIAGDGRLPASVDILTGSIFDYFASELFGRVEPQTRDFLMKTSFLPRMTSRTAMDLTGNEHADKILSGLGHNNFFIQRHTTPEIVYQYHPLFREFLLSRAKETTSANAILKIKKKAALLLLATNQVESAFELLAEAGDWEDSIRLILMHAQSLAGQGRFATLIEWIERIPEPIYETQSWLIFWLGVSKKAGNPPQGRALFERALGLFQAQGDAAGMLLAWAEIVDTFLYEWNDFHPLDRWITWLEGRMQVDPSFPSPEIEARVASCMLEALVFRRPDHPEIKKWLERAQNLSGNIADGSMRMQAYLHCLNYYLWMGDHANSFLMVEKIRSISRTPAATPFMTIINNWTEAVTYGVVAADFEASLRMAAEGLEKGERIGIHIWDHFLLTFSAFSALCKGDLAAAYEYLQKMETTFAADQLHNMVTQYHVSAWRYFLLGDYVHAAAACEKALSAVIELGMIMHIALYNIVLVHIYHASGDYQKAADQLALAHESVRRSQSLMLEHMYLLAKAYVMLHRGETAASIEDLRNAMTIGRRQGSLGFFFWWDPRAMEELCMKALEVGIEANYVQTLIRKRNIVPDAPPVHIESWPWPIKIHTLGRFKMMKDDMPVQFSGKVQQKPLSLLKAIVALGGKDVPQDRLTDALWPDSDGDMAYQSFDTTLHRLRKLIGNDKAIVLRDSQVSLDARYCWVDCQAFEQILYKAEVAWRKHAAEKEDGNSGDGSAEAVRLTEKAISLYQGHFLPGDAPQPWTISLRERLRTKYLYGVETLGRHWGEASKYEKTIRCFQQGLEVDDLAEEFYRHLMVCYHQLGQQTEAIRVYNRCRAVLWNTLGVKPSSKTEAVHYAIRQKG